MKQGIFLKKTVELLKELNINEFIVESKKNNNIVLDAKIMKQKDFHLDLHVEYQHKKDELLIKCKRMDKKMPFFKQTCSTAAFMHLTSIYHGLFANLILSEQEKSNWRVNGLEEREKQLIEKSIRMIEIYWETPERKDYPIYVNLQEATMKISIKHAQFHTEEWFKFDEEGDTIRFGEQRIDFDEYKTIVTSIQSRNQKAKSKRGNRGRILNKNTESIGQSKGNRYEYNRLDAKTGNVFFKFELEGAGEWYEGFIRKNAKHAFTIHLEEGYQFYVCKLGKHLIVADNYSKEPFVVYTATEGIFAYLNDPIYFFTEYFERKEQAKTFKGTFKKLQGKMLQRLIGEKHMLTLNNMFSDEGIWAGEIL